MSPREWPAEKLVSECMARKGLAWDELVRRFGPLVHGTVRKQLNRFGFGSRQDLLEDAYQEVFLSLTRDQAIGRVTDPAALPGYLAAMAVSKTVDLIRSAVREGSVIEWRSAGADADTEASDPQAECPRPNPRDEAQRRSIRDLIDRELDDLPRVEGLVARLKWQHDMTLDAISRMLALPSGTVATVLRRAKEKVRLSLLEKGIEE